MIVRTLLSAFVALGIAVSPAAAESEQIVLTTEDQERIALAKSRFDELIARLKQAQEIEGDAKTIGMLGEDQGISKDLGKGIKLIEFAKKCLDHGLATAEFLDKVITWHTAISCLNQSTECMTTDRSAACVRSYAYGMSRLFLMVHEELKREPFDFDKYDWKEKISLEYAMFAAFGELTQHYVEALKVAGQTYEKAAMWGQICKTKEICDDICSVPENVTLFDCPELQSVHMSEPMCVTLKGIVDGTLTAKTTTELLVVERASQFFLRHSDKTAFDRYAAQIGSFVDGLIESIDSSMAYRSLSPAQKSQLRNRASRAKSRFETSVAAVNQHFPPVRDAQDAEDLGLLQEVSPPLDRASCQVQRAAVEVYAVSLHDQRRFEGLLSAANALGACGQHEKYLREIQSRDPVDCLGAQCPGSG